MTSSNRLWLTVILAVMIGLAGCTAAMDDPADDTEIEANELQKQSIEAMEELTTVQFELEQSTDSPMGSQDVVINGAMDVEAEAMQMTMDLGETDIGLDTSFDAYIVSDLLYINVYGQWLETTVSDSEIWEYEKDQVDQQQDLLEASELEIQNTTTFNGHEVYVVDLDLDSDKLHEIATDSGESGQESSNESELTEKIDVDTELNDVSVTQYIDTETYHVRHSKMNFTMDSKIGEISYELGMTFENFNKPVAIELPEAAENAVDIDEFLDLADGFGDGFEFDDGDFDGEEIDFNDIDVDLEDEDENEISV